MARRLALVAVGGLLVFAAPAQAGISPGAALKVLNQWKRQAHEPTIPAMDPAENTGCAHHNHYMKLNGGQLTHSEESGKPGYTNDGAAAGAHSVLAEPEGTPRVWEGSVYHRMGILNPRMTKSGWAASEGFTCMQIFDLRDGQAGEPVKTYPWPPNGGTGFATTFTDHESPDPHDLYSGTLGYLLSVNLGGPWRFNFNTHVSVAHASLKTQSGSPVTLTIVDDDTHGGGPGGSDIGPYLNDAFALFPHGALAQRTTYVAHADGKSTYSGTPYPFSVTWSFRTGPLLPGKASLALSKGHRDGKKVKFTLTASQSLVGRKATKTVNGRHPVQIKLVRSQTIRTRRPEKGKTVRVVVTTPAFVRGDYSYPAAKASRKFTRKP
jgi:hypothetical protein